MKYLIMIRHSISQPQPEIPADEWQLTEAGRQQCAVLAERLSHYAIDRIISSDERKAVETARYTFTHLGGALPEPLQEFDLRETHRRTVPFYETVGELHQAIKRAMEYPAQRLFGEETFDHACKRFAGAVDSIVETYPDETIALVSHGTIISLYLAQITGFDTYTLWRQFNMPAYAVFALPDMQLCEICFRLSN